MKIGTIIEPDKIARAFLSDDKRHSLTNEVIRLMSAGANHIEIGGEAVAALPDSLSDKFQEEVWGGLKDLHENESITFSVHLPFLGGVNFTTSIESIRRASIEVVRNIVKQCSPLEPLTYVLHISGLLEELMDLGLRDEVIIETYLAYAAKSIEQIIEFIPAERLCIENLEYIAFDKIYPLVKKFGLSVCMDVGHIKLRNEVVDEFINRYGSLLGQIHLHDVTKKRYDKRVTVIDDHRELGSGIIDPGSIIHMLRDAEFKGPVVLEVYDADPINSIRILKEAVEKAK